MLKKIAVDQLINGMYIHELCSSGIATPFWQKSFMLENRASIDKIKKNKIQEVWIDTSKGLDALHEKGAKNLPLANKEIFFSDPTFVFKPVVPVSMDEELGLAARIVDKSKEAVVSMFKEARMGKAVDTEKAMLLVEEIASSVMRNPGALIGLVRLKTADSYTYMHSVAVCALMIALSRQLELDDNITRDAGLAGLLHDIGKVSVPPDILNKPGKLTDAEFILVKEHSLAGHKMLLETKGISAIVLDVCLHHHEKMDGTGYPDRLPGDQISLYARMGAVCDVYDAITSDRPYKAGWCPSESLHKMAEWSKTHFDEDIFQAFVKSIGIYPVGTLVRLRSDRLGVVVEQQVGKSLLFPKVRVFFSTKSSKHITPVLVDLSKSDLEDKIVGREEAGKWGLGDINHFWLSDPANQVKVKR